jgi:hypothetical protein
MPGVRIKSKAHLDRRFRFTEIHVPTCIQPPPRVPGQGEFNRAPTRWPNAVPLAEAPNAFDPLVPSPPRALVDDMGLPTGIGEWKPMVFFLRSQIRTTETSYGCGGLMCVSLLGDSDEWYWEDATRSWGAGGIIRHRQADEAQMRLAHGHVIFAVIPNAPASSPLLDAYLPAGSP